MDAVKERTDPRITLSAVEMPNKKIVIKVTDNGSGMSEEVMNNIFIPFFSTKKKWKRDWVESMQTDHDAA